MNFKHVQGVPKKRPHVLNAHTSLKNGTTVRELELRSKL